MKPAVVLLIFLAIGTSSKNLAQTEKLDLPCHANPNRPCIGLVLGGGGARGGAHLGVLQELVAQGIPIDLVVGTSIGAFVGGLYASGRSAEEIGQLFADANWNQGYQDTLGRSNMRNRRKRQIDEYSIRLDLGLGPSGISLPQGIIQGQGLKTLIDGMLGYFPRFTSFDELPIPFRAVAADIETGEAIVLFEGDLATAVQTSMSLPGIVRPVQREGRLLVDGVIANNLPIDVARAMGAEIIIAVDVGSAESGQDELQSGLSILRQLTSLLTRANVNYQKSLLTDEDLLVVPRMDSVSLLSFDRIEEAMEAGSLAAQQAFSGEPEVSNYANRNTLQKASVQQASQAILINEIALINETRLADRYIFERLDIEKGQAYTPADIQKGIDRLYGQGTIARVYSSTTQTESFNTLNLVAQEKEWGPGYLDLKFGFEDDYSSLSRYQLGASYRYTNLSAYGAEWYSSAQIGTEKKITTELYWPLATSKLFGEVSAEYAKSQYAYLVEGESVGELTVDGGNFLVGMGWNITDRFDVLLGNRIRDGRVTVPKVIAELSATESIAFNQDEYLLRVNYDSLDNSAFPRRGWRLLAEYSQARDRFLDIRDNSTRLDAQLSGVVSLGRHSLRGNLRYQRILNEDPLSLISTFRLGGFLNLSGYFRDELIGQHARFASAVYTYELAANNFGTLSLPLYLGASLEAGNVWNDAEEINYGDVIIASSVFLGWNSPFGPAYFGYGKNDQGKDSLYLFLGVSF